MRYTPFGEFRVDTGDAKGNKRFQGAERVASIELDLMGARFYSARFGRFISADTIVPGAGNPQSFNRYSFVLNNPLKFVDPSGHRTCDGSGECEYWDNPQWTYNWYKQHAGELGYVEGSFETVAVGYMRLALSAKFESQGNLQLADAYWAAGQDNIQGAKNWSTMQRKSMGEAFAQVWRENGAEIAMGMGPVAGQIGGELISKAFSKLISKFALSGVSFDFRQIQSKFKHASDFGVNGDWNKANATKYVEAMNVHINDSNTQKISGTYRGEGPVTHYYNPKTEVNLIVDVNGNFISGWKLYPSQINSLLTTGDIR